MERIAQRQNSGRIERIVDLLRQMADDQGVTLPSETESLFDAGVMDSFGMLEFITVIEEEFNIKIPDDDLVPSHFDTMAKIQTYIYNRLDG